MPEGGAVFVNKDGKKRWFYSNEFTSARNDGWEPQAGQRVLAEEGGGSYVESVDSIVEHNERSSPLSQIGVRPLAEQAERLQDQQFEEQYGGTGGALASLGIGAASGLTFGTSSWLLRALGVDKETLLGLQRTHPYASFLGEAGGILGSTALTGGLFGVLGGGANVGRAGGGAALTLRGAMTADALEGAAYAFGHGVGQLALRDEPLAAEALWQDLGVGTILGAGTGGLMGAAFGVGGKISGRFKGGQSQLDDLLNVATPEGAEFTGGIANSLNSFSKSANDLTRSIEHPGIGGLELSMIAQKGARFRKLEQSMVSQLDNMSQQVPVAKTLERFADREATIKAFRALRDNDDAVRAQLLERAHKISIEAGPVIKDLGAAQSNLRRAIDGSAAERQVAFDAYHASLKKISDRLGWPLEEKLSRQIGQMVETPLAAEQNLFIKETREMLSQVQDAGKQLAGYGGLPGILTKASISSEAENAARMAVVQGYAGGLVEMGKRLKQPVDEVLDLLEGPVSFESLMARTSLEGGANVGKSLQGAGKEFRAVFGLGKEEELTGKHISQFLKKDPETMLAGLGKLQAYTDEFKNLAGANGKTEALAEVQGLHQAIEGVLNSKLIGAPETLLNSKTAELALALGVTQMPDLDGPWDDIAKYALVAKVLGAPKALAKVGSGLSRRSPARSAVMRGAARAGANLGWQASKKLGITGGLGASMGAGVGSSMAFHGAGMLMDKLSPVARASAASGGVTSAIADTVHSLAYGTASRVAKPGLGALAMLKTAQFGEGEPKGKTLAEVYKHRKEQILRLTANPMALQQAVHEAWGPVRMAHLGLGDKGEMQTVRILQFLASKLPRDPGLLHRVGVSRWKESDIEMRRFARYVSGAINPVAAVQKIADKTITPQEAEALRILWPATFGALQRQIAENLPEIQKNSTYDQRISLSIAVGFPVDSVMRPEFRMAMQQYSVQRGIISSNQSTNNTKLSPEPLTKSQQGDARRGQ